MDALAGLAVIVAGCGAYFLALAGLEWLVGRYLGWEGEDDA